MARHQISNSIMRDVGSRTAEQDLGASARFEHEQEDDRDGEGCVCDAVMSKAGPLDSLLHKSHFPCIPFAPSSWTNRASAEPDHGFSAALDS